jgi:hypothetical protein
MGLDNIKNNPPVGAGGGPADANPAGGPPDTSTRRTETHGGPPDHAPGLRGDSPDRPTRRRGRGNDQHPRVHDVLNEGKQKLQKLVGQAGDLLEGRTRGARGEDHIPPGQAKNQNDGGRTDARGGTDGRDTTTPRTTSPENDGRGRSTESHGRSNESHGRSNEVHGYERSDHGRRTHGSGDDGGRSRFRSTSNSSGGGSHGVDGLHGRGARGLGNDALGGVNVSSLVGYLRGDAGGANIPRELRQVLDGASRLLGPDLVNALERRGGAAGGEHAVKLLEHALARVARTLGRVAEAGGAAATGVPPRVFGEAVGELLAATLLDKYFRQAENTGGRVVAQAEAMLARLLYGEGRGEGGGRRAPGGFESPQRPSLPAPHPLEVLRDLQAGAFRPAEVGRSPFPLNGRALVATEMMEMMRTLDAVDRATRELLAKTQGAASTLPAFGLGDGEEAPLLALLRALAGTTTSGGAELLDELLALLPPTLPGRAARLEIPRLVAALGGVLTDAEGHAFVTKEGVSLKLDQLMWLGSLGGVMKSAAGAESFPVHLSPLLIHGFDAVYSLIGFDGRTLNPPHFAAVQAQVNGSELEWVFGQPPLSEGWMRALIERLKDSALGDHNLLGEMLEEALADGRFHAALVGGTVSEGEAVADTFAVTRLLPGATVDAAFA